MLQRYYIRCFLQNFFILLNITFVLSLKYSSLWMMDDEISIGAWPFLAKIGYPLLGAYPFYAKIGYAEFGAYTILAVRVLLPIGLWPILARIGHAAKWTMTNLGADWLCCDGAITILGQKWSCAERNFINHHSKWWIFQRKDENYVQKDKKIL